MQESRVETSPEEAKIYRARNLDEKLSLQQQNAILRNNVKELQGQLQDAYKRIAELNTTINLAVEIQNEKQMELDI
jgi:outer membrane protein assembly factor BamA